MSVFGDRDPAVSDHRQLGSMKQNRFSKEGGC
jgi:hypothetical protein